MMYVIELLLINMIFVEMAYGRHPADRRIGIEKQDDTIVVHVDGESMR